MTWNAIVNKTLHSTIQSTRDGQWVRFDTKTEVHPEPTGEPYSHLMLLTGNDRYRRLSAYLVGKTTELWTEVDEGGPLSSSWKKVSVIRKSGERWAQAAYRIRLLFRVEYAQAYAWILQLCIYDQAAIKRSLAAAVFKELKNRSTQCQDG